MSKMFNKYETPFCILLIVFYIVVNSLCLQFFGINDFRSVIVNTLFSYGLLMIISKLDKEEYYGLVGVKDIKKYLYFIPLGLILTVNLWNGFNITGTWKEMVFYVLNMLNIGFIEEIIFRGFLFKMMEKDNLRNAIIVSSITFGVGHIINLFMGAELISTLLQIAYATSIGYLFVTIFHKSKSLIPCIITHSLMNALSVFNIENTKMMYISGIFLIIVPLIYAFYINKKINMRRG